MAKPPDAEPTAKERIERLRYRAELRSIGEEEDSALIQQEAAKRSKAPSSGPPAHAKGLVAVLNTLPPWGRVLVLLALLGALVAGGLVSNLAGLWGG